MGTSESFEMQNIGIECRSLLHIHMRAEPLAPNIINWI